MKKKITSAEIQATLKLLSDASTETKKQVPMYLYIDKKTGRQIKSELPLKEFLAYLKQLKKDKKKI